MRKKTSTKPVRLLRKPQLDLPELLETIEDQPHLIAVFTLKGDAVVMDCYRNKWPHIKTTATANVFISGMKNTHIKETGRMPW